MTTVSVLTRFDTEEADTALWVHETQEGAIQDMLRQQDELGPGVRIEWLPETQVWQATLPGDDEPCHGWRIRDRELLD